MCAGNKACNLLPREAIMVFDFGGLPLGFLLGKIASRTGVIETLVLCFYISRNCNQFVGDDVTLFFS